MTRAAAALVTLLALAGCAAVDDALLPEDPARELAAVPFFPQTIHQCGPAALATVLGASGVPATPEELVPLVYLPERRGSLQVEMLAAARSRGRVAYVLDPAFDAVRAELAAGTPVLVLQDLGLLGVKRWHFAVVVGYDEARDVVILRSGTRRRELERRADFLRTWQAGGNWAAVVVPAGRPPATATGERFIRALADAAKKLPGGSLQQAHAAALARWPADPVVLFAAGNDAFLEGQLPEAVGLYRRLLVVAPGHAAGHNNLANALLDAGCTAEGREEAQRAVAALTPGSALERAIRDTARRAALEQPPADPPAGSLCRAE